MASYLLRKESREILDQMRMQTHNEKLACPILKVLQMRHRDLDIDQAVKIVKDMLDQ